MEFRVTLLSTKSVDSLYLSTISPLSSLPRRLNETFLSCFNPLRTIPTAEKEKEKEPSIRRIGIAPVWKEDLVPLKSAGKINRNTTLMCTVYILVVQKFFSRTPRPSLQLETLKYLFVSALRNLCLHCS